MNKFNEISTMHFMQKVLIKLLMRIDNDELKLFKK